MYTLYFDEVDVISRKVFIALMSKKAPFQIIPIKIDRPNSEILDFGFGGILPMLTNPEGFCFVSDRAVTESLDTLFIDNQPLYHGSVFEKAEIRRMESLFSNEFDKEVIQKTVHQRLGLYNRPIISEVLRQGYHSLDTYLPYFESLLSRTVYIATNQISIADLAGFASLSLLEYFNELNLSRYPNMKSWYFKLKSRPAFQTLLDFKLRILQPSENYRKLSY